MKRERERDYLRTSNFMHYYPLHHLFFGYCFFFPFFFFFFFLLPTVQTPESSYSLLQVCRRHLRCACCCCMQSRGFDSQRFKKRLWKKKKKNGRGGEESEHLHTLLMTRAWVHTWGKTLWVFKSSLFIGNLSPTEPFFILCHPSILWDHLPTRVSVFFFWPGYHPQQEFSQIWLQVISIERKVEKIRNLLPYFCSLLKTRDFRSGKVLLEAIGYFTRMNGRLWAKAEIGPNSGNAHGWCIVF